MYEYRKGPQGSTLFGLLLSIHYAVAWVLQQWLSIWFTSFVSASGNLASCIYDEPQNVLLNTMVQLNSANVASEMVVRNSYSPQWQAEYVDEQSLRYLASLHVYETKPLLFVRAIIICSIDVTFTFN